ncbi:MAG: UvrD-helicase domain-containing protein [Planctomycetes bacterium]|nr:UvrD-helicase domain-containing protein [Planctomycetota bacterium]
MVEPYPDLTAAQREAVLHREGPLLVLAGAGSGKTRVITRRVAHLIETGVPAGHILAITFTNKAAGEMRERISELTGGARVWVSTFHSFCARLLRRYADLAGYKRDYTILDGADQRIAVREATIESALDPKAYPPPKTLYRIERAKDQLLNPAQLLEQAQGAHDQAIARIYDLYQTSLRESSAMDFSDLVMQAVLLLKRDAVREEITERFRFVLIDEYQDTNIAQFQLARLLSLKHGNVCATGDPDQSIYGWRGADVTNILDFEKAFPGAIVVKLEENFRSTGLILAGANGLIRHNRGRHEKDLVTSGPEGTPLEFVPCRDEYEEARLVASRIMAEIRRGVSHEEIAVFYRVGALSRAIEGALSEKGIAYRVVGSVAFYQRREVKDILSYLRLTANPSDDLAAQRVINVPARGVGRGTLEKAKIHASNERTSLFEAARALGNGKRIKNKRTRTGLLRFVEIVDLLRARARSGVTLQELVRDVLCETNYRAFVSENAAHSSEESDRLGNLEALCDGARDFDRRWEGPLLDDEDELHASAPVAPPKPAPRPAKKKQSPKKKQSAKVEGPAAFPLFADHLDAIPAGSTADPVEERREAAPAESGRVEVAEEEEEEEFGPETEHASGISAFLEHTALVSATDESRDQHLPRVSLMTIHAAKGLEFESVYVVAMEDGLFPHSRALEDGEGLEEERRLAYVAITRAKRRLVLTRARNRRHQGRSQSQEMSIFLHEIPPEAFPAGRSPLEQERSYAVGATRTVRPAWEEGIDGPGYDEFNQDDSSQPSWRRAARRQEEEGRGSSRPKTALAQPKRATAGSRADLEEVRRLAQAISRQGGIAEYASGDQIYHEHFGRGKVLAMRGRSSALKIEIEFEDYGTKTLVLQYARMRKLEAEEL